MNWETYEQVAHGFAELNKAYFRLHSVIRNPKLTGKQTGTTWSVDLAGHRQEDDGLVLVECKWRDNARVKQIEMAGLVYVMWDTGARGGIYVTTVGFQRGAARIAEAHGIRMVNLKSGDSEDTYSGDVIRGANHDYFEQNLRVHMRPRIPK